MNLRHLEVTSKKYTKSIYYWLMTGVALVVILVIIGGITRLTQSGLSMVRWEPIVGTIPPLNHEQWENEFAQYRSSPEFRVNNSHFTLQNFKQIYFWEYFHRLIGRLVGLVFLFPALFFWIQGVFDTRMKKQVILIFLGGLFQGVLGWYMVKSGLVDKPYVSHYRLAAHLSTALALAAYIYWVALEWKPIRKRATFSIRKAGIGLMLILGLQIIFGAFVAGLKAGKVFNTFPKMGRDWLPSDLGYAYKYHGIIVIFENGIVVQFVHRCLAYLVVAGVIWLWWKIKNNYPDFFNISNILLFLVCIQFLIGVLTLIWAVPISLGVIHQVGAVILLLGVVHLIKKAS